MQHIETVKIKEFKHLKDFEAAFNGESVLLIGDNGLGKSSLMQFIKIALGDQTCIPPNAIGSGEVVMTKDGKKYVLKVRFKDSKPIVQIITEDGLKDDRKGTLANLIGAIEFDINKFVDLSKTKAGRKEQVEIFKSLLPKEIQEEIARLQANVKAKFDERTELNRQVRENETLINSHPLIKTNLNSYVEVKIDDVLAKMEEATKHNESVRDVIKRKEDRLEKIEEDKKAILEIEQEIARLQEKVKIKNEDIASKQDLIKQAEEWLVKNPEIDSSDYSNTIIAANKANEDFKSVQELKQKIALTDKMRDESGDLTVLIETQRQAISDAIKDMDTPVEDLYFDEESLLYKGVPVSPDSLSTSEIMELGIRLKIVENEECILFIERGESLGEEKYNAIIEGARKENRQVFMEQVVRGKKELLIELIGE